MGKPSLASAETGCSGKGGRRPTAARGARGKRQPKLSRRGWAIPLFPQIGRRWVPQPPPSVENQGLDGGKHEPNGESPDESEKLMRMSQVGRGLG